MKRRLHYKIFFDKKMVDKLTSRQKLWLYIKNAKLILDFHPYKKSSGLAISQLLWLLTDKFCEMRQCRGSPLFYKFQYFEKTAVFLRFCEVKSRKKVFWKIGTPFYKK